MPDLTGTPGKLTEFPYVEQRSEDWYQLRRGIPTASSVDALISVRQLTAIDYDCPACEAPAHNPCRSKVKRDGAPAAPIKTMHPERAAHAAAHRDQATLIVEPSIGDEARNLALLLVSERITGRTEPTFTSSDMWRGILLEPVARDEYNKHNPPATEFGFMRRDGDGWTLGLSPDGVVGDDGLIEIKCVRAKAQVKTILADEVPTQYVAQCQAALLVSGRAWLDYISFHSGLPLFTKRVLPDPRWFAALQDVCEAFEETAQAMVADYQIRSAGLPLTEYIPDDLEVVI